MPRSFFDRPVLDVARGLLGYVIEHETPAGLVAVLITEVEAYAGAVDAASHAYRGRTRRNEVMFGPPGHVYVYFTYGMHFCANLVCLGEGTAAAVLLRAGRVIAGAPLARARARIARPVAVTAAGQGPGQGPGQALPGARRRQGAQWRRRVRPRVTAAGDGQARLCHPESSVLDLERVCGKAAEVPWRFWVAGESYGLALPRLRAKKARRR